MKPQNTAGENRPIPSFLTTIVSILREGGLALGLLLLTALALKVAFQIEYDACNPLADHPVSDELLYITTATEIASGRLSPGTVFHNAPLYPYLVAPVMLLFDGDPMAVRLLQAIVGTASILLIYLIARMLFTKPWALGACAATLLYYPFTFFEGKVLIVTSVVFFLHLGLLLLIGLFRMPRPSLGLWSGLALGTAAALRPNLVLLIPPLALLAVWALPRGRKIVISLLLVLGAALPILPFTLHNYLVEDDLVLLSSNGGVNFYFGNNPVAKGSFHVEDPRWGRIEHQYYMAKEEADAALGSDLKPSEVSGYWKQKGLSFIQEQPGAYLRLLYEKLRSFLDDFEYGIIYTPTSERGLTVTLALLFLPYALLVALAGAGAAAWLCRLAARNDRTAASVNAEPTQGAAAWTAIVLSLVITVLSVLLFFNYSRFRLTAVPAMALIGFHGLRQAMLWFKAGRLAPLVCVMTVAAGAFCYSYLPQQEKKGEISQQRQLHAHGLASIASAFSKKYQDVEADRYFTKALEIGPEMDLIVSKRGRARLNAGNYEGARSDLERALELKPDLPTHLANLADFYGREGSRRDLDKAVDLIQEAFARGQQLTPVMRAYLHMIEGMIRMERGEYDLAIGAYQAAHLLTPYVGDPLFYLGLAYRRKGEEEQARSFFNRCLELEPAHAGALRERSLTVR